MSFAIVTDTAANLPGRLLEKYNMTAIPFSAMIEGAEYAYTTPDAFDCHTYYESLRNGTAVTTSQVNPDRYIEYLTPILQRGEDVLFVGVSSGVSGSFSSAQLARRQLLEQFPQRTIRLVDSLSAALGEGLLALEAALCRQKEMTIEKTAEHLEKIRTRIYHLFTVDDLKHLHRSGRISHFTATIGSVLGIKPLLKGSDEGRIVPCDKVRGRRRVLSAMAERYASLVRDAKEHFVGISHADCPDEAKALADLICQKAAPKELILTPHEPATGAHIGPGAIALFFFGEDGVRTL